MIDARNLKDFRAYCSCTFTLQRDIQAAIGIKEEVAFESWKSVIQPRCFYALKLESLRVLIYQFWSFTLLNQYKLLIDLLMPKVDEPSSICIGCDRPAACSSRYVSSQASIWKPFERILQPLPTLRSGSEFSTFGVWKMHYFGIQYFYVHSQIWTII